MCERLRVPVGVGAALVFLVLMLGNSTQAKWTAAATIPGARVQTGLLDLQVDDFSALSAVDLVPGQTVQTGVRVTNSGSVPLDFGLSLTGNDAGLVDALALDARAGGCGGSMPSYRLAPGGTSELCVRVVLSNEASRDLAGLTTPLTLNVTASNGGWTDPVALTGSSLSTVAIQAPTLSCTVLGAPMGVNPVPGATSYRLHGVLGGVVEVTLDQLGSLGDVIMGLGGLLSAQAVFGSQAWVSDPGTTCA